MNELHIYQTREQTKKKSAYPYCYRYRYRYDYSLLAVVVIVSLLLLFLGMMQTWNMISSSTHTGAMHTNTNTNQNSVTSSSMMQYKLINQGHLDQTGKEFLKYKVVHSSSTNKKKNNNNNQVMSMKQWAERLANDYESFNLILASCPFDAFFWECAPVTEDDSNHHHPMEFVLVNAPELVQFARTAPDRMAFRHHFSSDDNFVAVFSSLGKDALLVAPSTQSVPPFTDFAYFARHASNLQQRDLYQRLSQVVLEQINSMPTKQQTKKPLFWLSTSGMGIAWMHIRIDSRPKYYTYQPYKSTTYCHDSTHDNIEKEEHV